MGTDIKISPLFFAVVLFLIINGADDTVTVALFSSILHECGHLAALIFYGCSIESITLSFYGMKIVRKNELSLSLKKEIAVALAGVTVNFVLTLMFFTINIFSPLEIFEKISAVNFLLGLFNILPVFPLDGGRALLAFLSIKTDTEKSEKTVRIVAAAMIIPIFFLGLLLAVKRGNFTILICSLYLAVSSF